MTKSHKLDDTNRHVFSHLPRGQKSETRLLAGLCSLKALEEGPFLSLPTSGGSGCPWASGRMAPGLCLRFHGDSRLRLSSPLARTLVVIGSGLTLNPA